MSALLQQVQAAKAAGAVKDQSVADKGFTRKVTPEGTTTARLLSYIEIGNQKQRDYKGEKKDDAPMVRITFELNGPAYMRNIAKEGEPEKLIPTILTEEIKLSTNDKAKYYKLFLKMKGDRENITHMAEMVGDAFIITIKHNVDKKDPTKKYANIYTTVDGWMVSPPFETSAATGVRTEVPTPALSGTEAILLQDFPSIEQWDSIFIDGTFKRKVGDEEVEVSKNFVQFKCLGSSSFKGSPLEALLIENNAIAPLLEAKAKSDAAFDSGKKEYTPAEEKKPTAVAILPEGTQGVTAAAVTASSAPVEEAGQVNSTGGAQDAEAAASTQPQTETAAVNPLTALGLAPSE